MKSRRRLIPILVLIFTSILFNCNTRSTSPEEVTLSGLEILPLTATLAVGQTQQFACTAHFSDESSQRITEGVYWSTAPGTSGQIDSTGLFTAINYAGTDTITAFYESKQAQAVAFIVNSSDAPAASFIVNPAAGTTDTEFSFDASGSSDHEDPASSLQVRWDWENDGTWDTDYTTEKTATHRYDSDGIKIVVLQVRDVSSMTDTTTNRIVLDDTGTMTGNDGKIYQTVKIGNQWWMAENLKETLCRNGEAIPEVTSDWTALGTGARCAYHDDANNESDLYGYLYNWYAIDDSVNLIAPAGWHVPSDEEWKELEMALGMRRSEADKFGGRGTNEGSKLAGNAALWAVGALTNNWAFGESRFTALPAGYRSSTGFFANLGYYAKFWTAAESDSSEAWTRNLRYTHSLIIRQPEKKYCGHSVRLLRD